jgi:hypothetical protein
VIALAAAVLVTVGIAFVLAIVAVLVWDLAGRRRRRRTRQEIVDALEANDVRLWKELRPR